MLGKRTGFTLIELLVVIAIIAILAAMLMPALSRAREAARTANCINNGKQIGLVFRLYADSQGDWIPTGHYWYRILGTAEAAGMTTYPIESQDSIWICPTMLSNNQEVIANCFWNTIRWRSSYGVNEHWREEAVLAPEISTAIGHTGGVKLSQMDRPSQTFLLASGNDKNGQGSYRIAAAPYESWAPSSDTAGDPHTGQTTLVFPDGHAEAMILPPKGGWTTSYIAPWGE